MYLGVINMPGELPQVTWVFVVVFVWHLSGANELHYVLILHQYSGPGSALDHVSNNNNKNKMKPESASLSTFRTAKKIGLWHMLPNTV